MIVQSIQSTLHAARHVLKGREIQLTSEGINGGNILYSWMWAHKTRLERPRSRAVVEYKKPMDPWLAEFPPLRELTVKREDFKTLDIRWPVTRHIYGVNFTEKDTAAFVAELASAPSFTERLERARAAIDERTLVVNVRRGDYYTVPEFTAQYALNYVKHIEEARAYFEQQGRTFDSVLYISDDRVWCRSNLAEAVGLPEKPMAQRDGLFDDLAHLAASHSLILANSTFSYWGSYFASALTPGHLPVAPAQHIRRPDTGEMTSEMFLPSWHRTSVEPGLG